MTWDSAHGDPRPRTSVGHSSLGADVMMGGVTALQIGVGPIGESVLAGMLSRGVKVLAAVDSDASARDVAARHGIPTFSSLADAPRGAEVVTLCTGSRLDDVAPQVLAALDYGASVVSTCEELAYPWYHQPVSATKIDQAARAADRTVLATGVNPGFAMDAIAIYLSGAVDDVRGVRVHRLVDAATRRPQLQAKIGLGRSVTDFQESVDDVGHVGLVESVAMLGAAFRFNLVDISRTIEPVVADNERSTDHTVIKRGAVAGVREIARGKSDSGEVVTLELEMYVGAPQSMDTVTLEGRPTITNVLSGMHGDLCTAAIVANAVGAVASLRAGLVTMIDAAPIRWHTSSPIA